MGYLLDKAMCGHLLKSKEWGKGHGGWERVPYEEIVKMLRQFTVA